MREELDDREFGRSSFENCIENGAIEIDGEVVDLVGDGGARDVAADRSSLKASNEKEGEEEREKETTRHRGGREREREESQIGFDRGKDKRKGFCEILRFRV